MHQPLTGVVFIGLIVLAACSSSPDTVRIWTTADGDPVPPRLIQMKRGLEHCGWENVWFLNTRNPGDTELLPVTQNPGQFVLDPEGVVTSEALKTTYSSDAELPADAVFTGYVSEGAELWASESTIAEAVFLVGGTGVERLPRAATPIFCD